MMIVNVWTKEAFDFEMVDLSEGHELCEDVLALYNKHKGDCERFLVSRIFDTDTKVRRFYVYAWFAEMTPKSYFYVGKGTGKRYDHILADIKKYKNGKIIPDMKGTAKFKTNGELTTRYFWTSLPSMKR